MQINGKNHISLEQWKISFLHTKRCGNAILVRNEGISPHNFSINPLKIHRILNKKERLTPEVIKIRISPNKKSTNPMRMNIPFRNCYRLHKIGQEVWDYPTSISLPIPPLTENMTCSLV